MLLVHVTFFCVVWCMKERSASVSLNAIPARMLRCKIVFSSLNFTLCCQYEWKILRWKIVRYALRLLYIYISIFNLHIKSNKMTKMPATCRATLKRNFDSSVCMSLFHPTKWEKKSTEQNKNKTNKCVKMHKNRNVFNKRRTQARSTVKIENNKNDNQANIAMLRGNKRSVLFLPKFSNYLIFLHFMCISLSQY